jgi:uncharacterized protein with HEPN domain
LPSSKPRQRLEDIVYNVDAIMRYTAGMDEASFVVNSLVIDAVERCLSRISEAAVKLGDDAARLVPGQPWHNIRGLGNRLRHEYDVISPKDLWAIVSDNLPSLRVGCQAALDALGNSSP